MAAYLQAPRSLAGAAEQLLGIKVDKAQRDQMKGVRWSDLNAIGQQGMIEYGQKDADVCLNLWATHADKWPESERRLAHETVLMGWKGLPVDFEGAAGAIEILSSELQKAADGIPWVADGKKPMSRKEFDAYCQAEDLPVPESRAKDDEDFAEWLEKYAADHPVVGNIRAWNTINTQLHKAQTLHSRTDENSVFHYDLKYCGAQHTTRWSGGADKENGQGTGGKGFNPQNIMRDSFYGVNFRSLIKAPEGHTFVITDSSQIEPRCLDWVVGDEESLERMRNGWNPYEALACDLGWKFEKDTLKKNNKPGYGMVKGMRLGLGYRMGAAEFVRAAPLLTNGDYRPTQPEADKACRLFRKQKPRIVALWEQFDALLRDNVGGNLEVGTPAGGTIHYYNLKRGRFGIEGQVVMGGRWRHLHGGILTENLIQRMARDVFAHILAGLLDAGLDIRLHVHDEAVTLCHKKDTQAVQKVQEAIFIASPEWATGLPLACETTISERYCK
jgi:hypothetical protein